MEEISNRLREIVEADARKRKGQILSQHEQREVENFYILAFAKANNLWIDDIYSLGSPTGLKGNESTILIDSTNSFVVKVNDLSNVKFLVSNLLNQVKDHNQLFPETRYELIGFTGIDNGLKRAPYIEVILKQDLVKEATQANPQEIIDFMESLNFVRNSDTSFSNDDYIVFDLYPRNVLKDHNGVIYVVDNIITKL